MLVVLSPAKKLSIDGEKPTDFTLPQYTKEAQQLIKVLSKYSPKKLIQLMGISPTLAELNHERYLNWQPKHNLKDAKQAMFTFTGEVYSGLDASSFSKKDIEFAQNHLRILSGLYGVLKPMDLIHAYRLEMGTSLKVGTKKSLYEFWGDTIVNNINQVLQEQGDDVLVNLASNEYFKAINKKRLKAKVVVPVFKDFKSGQYKTIMVYAKKARGMMAAFIIKNQIKNINDLIAFDVDGYCYNKEVSTTNEMVFYRG
ncbi:MAG: peroxide stress protein YaaA [Vicingus serpentipes]|nr:peroxide stress protein YaaA [Vicingus serpentipes]